MATNNKTPRDLLAERIRRLEKQGAETNKRLDQTNSRLDQTNSRLDQVVSILGSIANSLAGQGRELERHSQLLERHSQLLQTLTERLDRFADMVIIGRTRDTERVEELEQRVGALERQVFRGVPPSSS